MEYLLIFIINLYFYLLNKFLIFTQPKKEKDFSTFSLKNI